MTRYIRAYIDGIERAEEEVAKWNSQNADREIFLDHFFDARRLKACWRSRARCTETAKRRFAYAMAKLQ